MILSPNTVLIGCRTWYPLWLVVGSWDLSTIYSHCNKMCII